MVKQEENSTQNSYGIKFYLYFCTMNEACFYSSNAKIRNIHDMSDRYYNEDSHYPRWRTAPRYYAYYGYAAREGAICLLKRK